MTNTNTGKIIITEIYDDGGDLIEIQVDAVGEAAEVFDEGVSVKTEAEPAASKASWRRLP